MVSSGAIVADRVRKLMRERGISQAELARRIAVSQTTIGKIATGQVQGSVHLHKIARVLETSIEYLTGEVDDPSPGTYLPQPEDDRLLEVPMIDLRYGMGGTFIEDMEIEERVEPFPKSFIRRYTKAAEDKLFFAEGIGDSMAPTIAPNDLLLIDSSDETLRMSDQIWAFSFGGVGMIKRLRPRPDGSVAILSDNPNVPEDRAVDDELHLIGRVVAKVSKL